MIVQKCINCGKTLRIKGRSDGQSKCQACASTDVLKIEVPRSIVLSGIALISFLLGGIAIFVSLSVIAFDKNPVLPDVYMLIEFGVICFLLERTISLRQKNAANSRIDAKLLEELRRRTKTDGRQTS